MQIQMPIQSQNHNVGVAVAVVVAVRWDGIARDQFITFNHSAARVTRAAARIGKYAVKIIRAAAPHPAVLKRLK